MDIENLLDRLRNHLADLFASLEDWIISSGLRAEAEIDKEKDNFKEDGLQGRSLDDIISQWYVIQNRGILPEYLRDSFIELQKWPNILNIKELESNNNIELIGFITALDQLEDYFICSFKAREGYEKISDCVDYDSLKSGIESTDSGLACADFSTDFKVGSLVEISSDKTKIGVITSIVGQKISVFIDNKIENYYAEQLSIHQESTHTDVVPLDDAVSYLTAFELAHPSSNELYSLKTAKVDFVPYQFRPALKIIKSDSPRILIADDVGVGKTIEAGLIIKELEARNKIDRILIICPRPLVAERKWETEMKRFEEDFTSADSTILATAITEADRQANWPIKYGKLIVPYSLFDEKRLYGTKKNGKKYTLGLDDLNPFPRFDLVIVDEAHYIRNSNTWAYKCVEKFCSNADAVVFLTATPLQNSNDDLYTLLNLLRPDLIVDKDVFENMGLPNKYINRILAEIRAQRSDWRSNVHSEINNLLQTGWGKQVISRNPAFVKVNEILGKDIISKEDKVALISYVEELHTFNAIINRTRRRDIEDFCVRRSHTITVDFTDKQRTAYTRLIEFEREYLVAKHGTHNVFFMMCMLMRQASSCISGLIPFLDTILTKKLESIIYDSEQPDYELNDECFDYEALKTLKSQLSSNYLDDEDPKFDKLMEIISSKQLEENNKVIVFSTFRQTLSYLKKRLEKKGLRVKQIDGNVPDEERFNCHSRFSLEKTNPQAIDVLLFSEVGCEGLDYQFCDTMINYDLPWNPMKIEQRIGRIDRRGQKSDTVRIYNIVTNGTIDSIVYDKCLTKIGIFEDNIGDCSEILGEIHNEILKIMMNPKLTLEEQSFKIEHLAENQIREIQELRKLEDEERYLFGFDLSQYILDKDVQAAENPWISPKHIENLVKRYLRNKFDETEFIRGKDRGKQLRLSLDVRRKLLDTCIKNKNLNKNLAYLKWIDYLKGSNPIITCTFDSEFAKNNPDCIFFTPMHPLVIEAYNVLSQSEPPIISIECRSLSIPSGIYAFQLYTWEYLGLKHTRKLINISDNDLVAESLIELLKKGINSSNLELNNAEIELLEQKHYNLWRKEREVHINNQKLEIEYKLEFLAHSFEQRKNVLLKLLDSANDERIRTMRRHQVDNLDEECKKLSLELNDQKNKAELKSTLLLQGKVRIYGTE